MNRKARTRLIVATVVLVAVFAVGVVWVVSAKGAYYRQVSDLSSSMDGKSVKVGGQVVNGTIERDATGVHFTMEDLTGKPTTIKVNFSGQMPATFAAGSQVVVTGKYAGDVIDADQMQTKCPSKYQGKASPAAQTSN